MGLSGKELNCGARKLLRCFSMNPMSSVRDCDELSVRKYLSQSDEVGIFNIVGVSTFDKKGWLCVRSGEIEAFEHLVIVVTDAIEIDSPTKSS